MRAFFFIIALLSIHSVYSIDVSSYDTFYSGSGCSGGAFSCGGETDRVTDINGSTRVNITNDDGLATYVCATEIIGGNAKTSSCIARQGFNSTICDSIIDVTAPGLNKSYLYNCSSSNLNNCGWNGEGQAVVFSTPAATTLFQINATRSNASNFIFIEYICNTTPKSSIQSPQYTYIVTDTKAVICQGNNYVTSAYVGNVSALFSPNSCNGYSFCDPTSLRNYSMSSGINDSFCTPGCDDLIQNSDETDVDYGGSVCGNCTPDGKSRDAFYQLAKELQVDDLGRLTQENKFNSTAYCSSANDVGSTSIFFLIILLFISGVSILLLLSVVMLFLLFAAVTIGTFLRNKYKNKKKE